MEAFWKPLEKTPGVGLLVDPSAVHLWRSAVERGTDRVTNPFQRVHLNRHSIHLRFGDGPDGRRQIGGTPRGRRRWQPSAPRELLPRPPHW
jgi:hypothetical protein